MWAMRVELKTTVWALGPISTSLVGSEGSLSDSLLKYPSNKPQAVARGRWWAREIAGMHAEGGAEGGGWCTPLISATPWREETALRRYYYAIGRFVR